MLKAMGLIGVGLCVSMTGAQAHRGPYYLQQTGVYYGDGAVRIHRHFKHEVRQEKKAEHRSAKAKPKPDHKPVEKSQNKNQDRAPQTAPDPADFDGIATAIVNNVIDTPNHIVGLIKIADETFHFGSGGVGQAIPYGDHLITPDDVGSWGARHGALGLDHDEMYDRTIHRTREGIEIHQAHGSKMMTEGCVGIDRFDRAKKLILAMIDEFGHAYLHIDPRGATVMPYHDPLILPADKYAHLLEAVDDPQPKHRRRYAAVHRSHHRHLARAEREQRHQVRHERRRNSVAMLPVNEWR